MFPVFEIFGRQIGVYGIMAAVGFAACFLVGRLLIRRYDIDVYDFALTMIAAGIGMAVGAAAGMLLKPQKKTGKRIVSDAMKSIGDMAESISEFMGW